MGFSRSRRSDGSAGQSQRMRELEYFRGIRLLPGTWPVIRVDGRGFTRFVGERFARPFDSAFRDLMEQTAGALLHELQGIFAYTMSDEISLLLPREWDLFDRRLEKTVSVSAGVASAAFTATAGEPAHFDSRVWLGADQSLVVDYFLWRQEEAARNALHSWCYWTLRKGGASVREATETLRGKGAAFQNELLCRHGINFNDVPLWQRRGVGIYWANIEKPGIDPRDSSPTVTLRRQSCINRDLPMKEEFRQLLRQMIQSGAPAELDTVHSPQ